MTKVRLLCGLLLLVLLSGCGYHFSAGNQSTIPGGVKTIAIPVMENLTARPFLETPLTNQVRSRFARYPGVELVPVAQAEAVLHGRISSYQLKASAFDALDNISEYRIIVQVDVELRAVADGRVLWKNRIEWDGTFPGGLDKNLIEANERKTFEVMAERIASEVLYRMLDDF